MSNINEHLISKNILSSLDTIPFHNHIDSIERFVPEKFPIHLAIHKINDMQGTPVDYCDLHSHDDITEVNLIIGDPNALIYRIQLDDEVYEVKSSSSIWIPPGIKHSANVISGTGYFVVFRLAG